ncbi:hypothetical protein BLOT_010155 [Blomia tropicalis]|nr:hypothetical protein BLOT_010155 [Blomia tropicalis]
MKLSSASPSCRTTVIGFFSLHNIVIGCTLSTYSMPMNLRRTYPGEIRTNQAHVQQRQVDSYLSL